MRVHRRQWAMTQRELALLLGCRSGEHVSRIEGAAVTPRLNVILAAELVFGVEPKHMFPKTYQKVLGHIGRMIPELERIANAGNDVRARKLRALAEVLREQLRVASRKRT